MSRVVTPAWSAGCAPTAAIRAGAACACSCPGTIYARAPPSTRCRSPRPCSSGTGLGGPRPRSPSQPPSSVSGRPTSLPAMDIRGTASIVTGGASGLGEATARLLSERGARVVVLDIQDDAGEALAKELGGAYAHADVTDAEQVIAAVEAAQALGPLRSLVNCAGIGSASRTIGRDGSYQSAHDLAYFHQSHFSQPDRYVQLHTTGRHRHEPDRTDGGRRAGRHRQHCLHGRLRWPDRAGGVLGIQRRDRRHDPANRAGSRRSSASASTPSRPG